MKELIAEYLRENLFDIAPYSIAVIDRDYNIVEANKQFEEYFGEWQGKKCYQSCKKSESRCSYCQLEKVFESGETVVSNESGIDNNGRTCHYIVHFAPMKDREGKIRYVVEMATDVTETAKYQRQYNLLFEKVPSYVTIIDKNYKIVRANKKFRDTFGEAKGKKCYEAYKKRGRRCKKCPARKTFKDGKEYTSVEVGKTFSGQSAHYIVQTTPLSVTEDGVQLVIETATDITNINRLESQIRRTRDFYAALVENAKDGILALNENNKVEIFNDSAKEILNWTSFKKPTTNQVKKMFPKEFLDEPDNGDIVKLNETRVKTYDDKEVPVRFNAIELKSKSKNIGRVAFFQDLRPIIELEKKKLEAERLGAVGQTVAGLAHTIKNLLMGLEGGMYIVDSGLRKSDPEKIVKGWDMLQKNFDKTTQLVRGFLSFAKGKTPTLQKINPNTIVNDIVELYKNAAKKQNVALKSDLQEDIQPVKLDPEGIEACLTNLISNAIDAASVSDDKKGKVIVKTLEENGKVIFKVIDNGCGMDAEVMKKVFTTFFTTKGSQGTGLGLLTTNRIVKEHGGNINVDSDVGKGSTFTMTFYRKTLDLISNDSDNKQGD